MYNCQYFFPCPGIALTGSFCSLHFTRFSFWRFFIESGPLILISRAISGYNLLFHIHTPAFSSRHYVGWPLVTNGIMRSHTGLTFCERSLSVKIGLHLRLCIDRRLSGTDPRHAFTDNQWSSSVRLSWKTESTFIPSQWPDFDREPGQTPLQRNSSEHWG